MNLCNHHYHQVFLSFRHPENSSMPDSGLSSSHAEPQETARLLTVSTGSPALGISRNGVGWHVVFYVGLLWVSVTFLAFPCVAACQYFVPFHRWAVFHRVDGPHPVHTSGVYSRYNLMAFLSSVCLLTSLPALPMEHGLPREPGSVWAAWIWSLRL